MRTLSDHMRHAIALCWDCRDECQRVFFLHSLDVGGAHVEAVHATLMTDCMQSCQTSADFMARGSAFYPEVCGACAEVCDGCAASCEAIGGTEMERCAEICRRCAASCREMAKGSPLH